MDDESPVKSAPWLGRERRLSLVGGRDRTPHRSEEVSAIPATPQAYIDSLPEGNRDLFTRVHDLICATHRDVRVSMAYGMPTYTRGPRRIHVAAWKHGVSIYGCVGRDGGFIARHPQTHTSSGTIQIRTQAAESVPDSDISALATAALGD